MKLLNIYIFIFAIVVVCVCPSNSLGFVVQQNGSSLIPQSLSPQYNYPDIKGDIERAPQNNNEDINNNASQEQIAANAKANNTIAKSSRFFSDANVLYCTIFILTIVMIACVIFWFKKTDRKK